jgi:hypothetical protein
MNDLGSLKIDRSGVIRIEMGDGTVLFVTRAALGVWLAEHAQNLCRYIRGPGRARVPRLVIAPIPGYLLAALPVLVDDFISISLADNFKAGQVFDGLECQPLDTVTLEPGGQEIVFVATVDPQLTTLFAEKFRGHRRVGLVDFIREEMTPGSVREMTRHSLADAYAAIADSPDVAGLLKFVEGLTAFACQNGDIGEFKEAINSLFERVYPQAEDTGESHHKIVDTVKSVYTQTIGHPYPDGYVVGAHWDRKQSGFARVALLLDDPRHIVLCAQHGSLSGFDHRIIGDPDTARAIISDKFVELDRDFKTWRSDSASLQESPFSIRSSVEIFDDREYSSIFLTHLFYYLRISQFLKADFSRVLEIGGGYGGLARIFTERGVSQYIIIDLPGSLIFSYTFLRLNFPDAKIAFISSAITPTAEEFSTANFVLVPPQFMHRLVGLDIDLVVNTGSMQEMPQETVDFFMNFIQNLASARYFYSFNYFICAKQNFSETSGHDDPSQSNFICPKLDRNWEILFSRLNPWGITIDCAGRNWLEILVKRRARKGDNVRRAHAQFLRSQSFPTMSDDWLRSSLDALFADPTPDHVRNMIDGIESFVMNKIAIPNNMFNTDGLNLAYRSRYDLNSSHFLYNRVIDPSPIQKTAMLEELGEIRYLRGLLAQYNQ